MADSPEEKNPIDLNKILLPKKEAISTDSAQRINAGALLGQEQKATLKPQLGEQNGLVEAKPTRGPFENQVAAEETVVKPLQTFQGDIEKVVQQKNVSIVSMASAEAERRAQQPLSETPAAPFITTVLIKKIAMVAGGVIFIGGAVALVTYVFWQPTTTAKPESPEAPFIIVDETVPVVFVADDVSRESLMRELTAARDTLAISLGLVARLQIGVASTSGNARELATNELLTTIAPRVPEELVRTLNKRHVLGMHSYDGNQPFLIFKSDSYERAFAGLLAWEHTMRDDLMPLFDRKAPVRAPLGAAGTSTVQTFLQTAFVDRIVENHDARVIQNEYNDILLLWTFLDRNTVLIATNDATVRDVIRRLKEAPLLPAI
ncbi:MAG: hypothetical protein AAB449_01120 [Patescibacteria group bacterium]